MYVVVCIGLLSTPFAADFGPRLVGGARSWTGSLLSTPLAADFRPGPEAAGRTAGRRYFFSLLSPPTLGLARRRRRRGTHTTPLAADSGLAGGGGGGARSWTGNLLSTPLPTDFRPGPDGAAEGRAAGRGICFLRFSPPT